MPEKETEIVAEVPRAPRYAPMSQTDLDMLLGDLAKDERLRFASLVLAIQYYTKTIVSDGALYTAMKAHNAELKPANIEDVMEIGWMMEQFINGTLRKQLDALTELQRREEKSGKGKEKGEGETEED